MVISKKDYKRAEGFLPWNTFLLVLNSMVRPNWINKSDKFWYIRESNQGSKYIIFDPNSKTSNEAFDHEKIALSFSKILNQKISQNHLQFNSIQFSENGKFMYFKSMKKNWICNLETYEIKMLEGKKITKASESFSPDGKWGLFIENNNLFLRKIETNEVFELTTDGEMHNEYAISPECNTHFISDKLQNKPIKPIVSWAPDSRKFVTFKIDQRKVKDLHLLQMVPLDGTFRPILYTYKVAFPGDEDVPIGELVVFDVEKRIKISATRQIFPILYLNPIEYKWVWWNKTSKQVFFIHIERYNKTVKLYEFDVYSGKLRILLEEPSDTFVDVNIDPESGKLPNVRLVDNETKIIWWSQRDGWGHLYLFNRETGEEIKQITSGEWVVFDIIHVDDIENKIYFTAGGKEINQDPYYRYLYRINFDGSDLQLLTPENADHDINFSPTGNYFIDCYSRVDFPTISIIRKNNGDLIGELERADILKLFDKGWIFPKPFKALSNDYKNGIYGLIYFPTTFDPKRTYPIIDYIYPGPQRINTSKAFPQIDDSSKYLFFWIPQTFAELGFIVVVVDGKGTPYRSKEFHDYCYGDLFHSTGIKDHIAAIKQLKNKHPYLDLERIGICGHSGGGLASARAIIEHPDFYKVAISSAGNHENRMYLLDWFEKYMPIEKLEDKTKLISQKLIKQFNGKLLLVHGELDDNVHPSSMMALINALIEANKDFDMLILPNRDHFFLIDPYFIRKSWDYFVKHLLKEEPPIDYKVKGIDPILLNALRED